MLVILTLVAVSSLAQSKTQQVILDLSKRKFDWMVNKRYDSLELLLDDQVKYIHSNGWAQSKKEVVDDFASGKLYYQKIEITESTVRLYDKTCIVIGKGKFSGIVNNNAFAMELSYTEVYVHKNDRWLLASRHANRMP